MNRRLWQALWSVAILAGVLSVASVGSLLYFMFSAAREPGYSGTESATAAASILPAVLFGGVAIVLTLGLVDERPEPAKPRLPRSHRKQVKRAAQDAERDRIIRALERENEVGRGGQ